MCVEALYPKDTYRKARKRIRKYERKQPLLPKLRGKTLYIKEKPTKEMFDDLRKCYDGPSKPHKDISTEFFGFFAMSGTSMDPLNEQ